MITKILRGIFVSILSAIIIVFMVFFFTPLLPFNIFDGFIGLLFFLGVILLSYLVYIFMPQEEASNDSISNDLNTNISKD